METSLPKKGNVEPPFGNKKIKLVRKNKLLSRRAKDPSSCGRASLRAEAREHRVKKMWGLRAGKWWVRYNGCKCEIFTICVCLQDPATLSVIIVLCFLAVRLNSVQSKSLIHTHPKLNFLFSKADRGEDYSCLFSILYRLFIFSLFR